MKIEVQVYQIFGSNANLVGDNNDLEHCDLYLQNLETYDINNKLNQNGQIKLSKKLIHILKDVKYHCELYTLMHIVVVYVYLSYNIICNIMYVNMPNEFCLQYIHLGFMLKDITYTTSGTSSAS